MRLLYLELNSSAGTDTVTRACLPLMLEQCEEIVFVSHGYRNRQLQSLKEGPFGDRLQFETLETSSDSGLLSRLVDGALRRLPNVSWVRSAQSRAQDARLRGIARRWRVDALYTPWIFDVRLPSLGALPVFSMAMDLNWHQFPENFPGRSQADLDSRFCQWLERSKRVFPVSDFSAKQIGETFPRFAPKIRSVPHGTSGAKPRLWEGDREGDRPIFFYPASMTSNKNHFELLKACSALWKEGLDFEVRLSGRSTDALKSEMPSEHPVVERCRSLVFESGLEAEPRLRAMGYIDLEEIEELYCSSFRILLPTVYEGFGLPMVEALEYGAPVICTDIDPLMEQLERYGSRDRALVINEYDADAIADAMREALGQGWSKPLSREDLQQRLGQWTWKAAVDAYCGEIAAHIEKKP